MARLTELYAEAGYERVVIDFVFEHPDHYGQFASLLTQPLTDVVLVTLYASLRVTQAREAQRRGRERISDAVLSSWTAIEKWRGQLGHVVDANAAVSVVLSRVRHILATGPPHQGV